MYAKMTRMLDLAAARNPLDVNTDWDGTLLVTALLAWHRFTGNSKYADFAKSWFEKHKEVDHQLSNEEYHKSFMGIRARIIRNGPIPFTAYCGHWGLGYACQGLAAVTDDSAVAAAAASIGDYILHEAPRSPHGCVYHDDNADFLIPDTCYFAAPVMAIAGQLTGKSEYVEHAVYQLKNYTALMQDAETGLAFTLWSREGMPRNFWSRASGWLAGAFVNTLEIVPRTHPAFAALAAAFVRIAEGIVRVQRPDGGFHVLLDRPDLPTDCTAPAMMAYALRKGVRLGLLDPGIDRHARQAWEACVQFVTEDGAPTRAYTGWAKSAVEEDFRETLFDEERDFVTGLILLAGAVMEEAW
jgi:rhamnogalacturonyl hydrolase YesR